MRKAIFHDDVQTVKSLWSQHKPHDHSLSTFEQDASSGATLIQWAVTSNAFECTLELLAHDADPFKPHRYQNYNAFELAASENRADCLLLLSAAHAENGNLDGNKLLSIAAQSGANNAIIALYAIPQLRCLLKVDATPSTGLPSALECARLCCHFDTRELLLSVGSADFDVKVVECAERRLMFQDRLFRRQAELYWKAFGHAQMVDLCIALAPLQLPSLVVLCIFDWLHWKHPFVDVNEKYSLVARISRKHQHIVTNRG